MVINIIIINSKFRNYHVGVFIHAKKLTRNLDFSILNTNIWKRSAVSMQ